MDTDQLKQKLESAQQQALQARLEALRLKQQFKDASQRADQLAGYAQALREMVAEGEGDAG